MKKNNYIWMSFILVSSIAVLLSCEKDSLLNYRSQETKAISEARAFFDNNFTKLLIDDQGAKGSPITPGDFTPLWDKAVLSQDGMIINTDVPIIPQYKYRATRVGVNGVRPQINTVDITQKIVIEKDIDKDVYSLFLVTLIPDSKCFSKKEDLSNNFITLGSKGKFSGVAVYSDINFTSHKKVERYNEGNRIAKVRLCDDSHKKIEANYLRAVEIIGNFKLSRKSSYPMTRWGENWGNGTDSDYDFDNDYGSSDNDYDYGGSGNDNDYGSNDDGCSWCGGKGCSWCDPFNDKDWCIYCSGVGCHMCSDVCYICGRRNCNESHGNSSPESNTGVNGQLQPVMHCKKIVTWLEPNGTRYYIKCPYCNQYFYFVTRQE